MNGRGWERFIWCCVVVIAVVSFSASVAHCQITPPQRGGTGTSPGTTLPATCNVGQIFFKTNATAGSNLYGCTSTNVWTVEAGGGGGGITPDATLTAGLPLIGAGTTHATVGTKTGTGNEFVASQSPLLITPQIPSFLNAQHNHFNGPGGGQLNEDALVLTNITTNDVSITKHGFTPRLPNDATKYLDGTGAYTVPSGGGGGATDTSQLTDLKPTKTSSVLLTISSGTAGILPASTVTFAPTQFVITSATAASPMVLTLASTPTAGSMHVGDLLSIEGATGAGCSGMNSAAQPIEALSGATVSITFDGSGCTYGASSATAGKNSSASGTIYVYGATDGVAYVEHPTAAGLIFVCTGTCGVRQVATPSFATANVTGNRPIGTVTLSATSGGTLSTLTDARQFLYGLQIVAGTGMSVTPSGQVYTVATTSDVARISATNAYTGSQDARLAATTYPDKNLASAPASCVKGEMYFNTANLHTYRCTVSGTPGTQVQIDGSSSADRQSWYPVACDATSGNNTLGMFMGGSSPAAPACTSISSEAIGSYFLDGTNSTIRFGKKASASWNAAAGTIDINAYMVNVDGSPSAGSNTVDISIGCWAGASGSLTYGTASTVTWTPPAVNKIILVSATPVLPGTCAADSLIYARFTAGGAGGTGVNVRLHMVEMVVRGN